MSNTGKGSKKSGKTVGQSKQPKDELGHEKDDISEEAGPSVSDTTVLSDPQEQTDQAGQVHAMQESLQMLMVTMAKVEERQIEMEIKRAEEETK